MVGSVLNEYLKSLKTEYRWMDQNKIDQSMSAVITFQDRHGNLTAPDFARTLIFGQFDQNQIQQLYQHVKDSHKTKDLTEPMMPDTGLTLADLTVDKMYDIRDLVRSFQITRLLILM